MKNAILGSILSTDLLFHQLEEERKVKIMETLIDYEKPLTLAELKKKIHLITSSLPGFESRFIIRNYKQKRPLVAMTFNSDYPVPIDANSMIYQALIRDECLRIYNELILLGLKEKYKGSRLAKTLIGEIEILCREASLEIKKVITDKDYKCSELKYFVLWQLKLQLIDLYFSVQELYKGQLKHPVNLVQFYLLILGETIYDIRELKRVEPIKEQIIPDDEENSTKGSSKFSFGFRGDKNKLKQVIYKLCKELELLNEKLSSPEELYEVLTCKNFIEGYKKIRLRVHTNQFRYIVDCMSHLFDDISLINIEKSKIFESKKGKLITANALSSTTRNMKRVKEADLIDAIIKELY